MAISEQLYTNANLAFGGGHWSLDGASAKWRAGNAQKSSTAGDTCTITLPGGTNARALYLFTGLGGSPAATPGGEFTVTVDGVAVAGDYSCRSANWYSNQQAYRVAMPIYRGLADTNHTIVLTVSGTGTVWVDSILLITGAKATPAAAGNLTLMGDSVTNNATGASSAQLGYTSRLANLLNARLGRTIVSSIQGVTGDRLVGSTAALFGLTSRWVDQLIAGSYPELTAFQNGSNDLAGNGGQLPAGEYGRLVSYLLALTEDVLDVSNPVETSRCKVAMCTPSYISPIVMGSAQHLLQFVSPSKPPPSSRDNFEMAVQAVRQVVAQFGWCRLADLWGAMDNRTGFVFPNGQGDWGNHPNDAGHGVIADEILAALVGGRL